jgi:hypothetical protein
VQVKTGSGTVDYYYFCSTQNEYFYIPGGSLYKIPLIFLQKVLGSQNCFSPQQFIGNTQISSNTQSLISPNNVEILNNLPPYNNQGVLSMISTGLYSVNLDILYGNLTNLVLNNNRSQWICRPTVLIGPFCAIYSFSTQAYTQN